MENKEVPTRFPWKASPKNGRILIDAAGEKVLTVNYGTGTAPFQVAKFTESACNALAGISDPVAFRKCFDDLLGAAAELVAECELHEQKTGQLVCGLTAMNTAIKNARTFTKES